MISSVMRTVAGVLVILSLAFAVVVPPPLPPDTRVWHTDATVSGLGGAAGLPALNERHEHSGWKFTRGVHLTLPLYILERGPVVHGAVILPVRDDVRLTSLFVYTQTTSSRL